MYFLCSAKGGGRGLFYVDGDNFGNVPAVTKSQSRTLFQKAEISFVYLVCALLNAAT